MEWERHTKVSPQNLTSLNTSLLDGWQNGFPTISMRKDLKAHKEEATTEVYSVSSSSNKMK